jgi:hypothetical protein
MTGSKIGRKDAFLRGMRSRLPQVAFIRRACNEPLLLKKRLSAK